MQAVVRQVNQVKASLRGMASTPLLGGGKQTQQELAALNTQALKVTTTFRNLRRYQRDTLEPLRMVSSGIVDQEIRWRNLGKTLKLNTAIARDQVMMQRALGESVTMTSAKLSVFGNTLTSVGANLIKTGKNMQWTGRQLTIGFTLPLVMLGRTLSNTAQEVDKQLTRIVKVYDFAGERGTAAVTRLRNESMETAQTIAEQFGIAASATLDLTATFAQMGKRGPELQRLTEMTTQVQLLGEVEASDAINLTRTVMDGLGMTIDETATSLQRLNAVENNTVLTLKDMSSEIPDLVGVMKSLNLPLEQAVAYLAAMKEAGLNVNEAQTALRNSITRLTKPTKIAVEHFRGLGISLDTLFSDAGNATEMMYALSDAIHGIPDPRERTRALAYLFDTRQAARMMVLLSAIREEARDTGAYAVALQQMGLSAEDARRLAMEETSAVAESLAGQVNRIKEEIKVMAASIGTHLVPKLIKMLGVIKSIASWFDNLGDRTKNWIAWGATIIAVAGPVVMLMGLFKNLTGLFFTLIGTMVKSKTHFQMLSAAMFNARLTNVQLNQGVATGAAALNTQYVPAVERATNSLRILSAEQARLRAQQGLGGIAPPLAVPPPPGSVGSAYPAVPVDPGAQRSLRAMLDRTKQISNQAKGMAGSFLLVAGSIGRASTEAGTLERKIANVAVGAGGLLMLLPMLTNPLGQILAVVGLIGGGFALWKSHLKDAREATYSALRAARELADTLDVTWQKGSAEVDEYGNVVESVLDRAERVKEEQAGLVEELRELHREYGSDAVQDRIIQIGYELKQHGASPEEIVDTVQVMIATLGPVGVDVKVDLDWESADKVAKHRAQALRNEIERTLDWEGPERDKRSFWQRLLRTEQLDEGTLEHYRDMGRATTQAFVSGSIEEMAQGVDPIVEAMTNRIREIKTRVSQNELTSKNDISVLRRSFGINADSFNIENWRDFARMSDNMVRQFDDDTERIVRNIKAQINAHDAYLEGLKEEFNIQADLSRVRLDLTNLTEELARAGVPVSVAQQEFNKRLEEAYVAGRRLTEQQVLKIKADAYETAGLIEQANAIRNTAVEVEGLTEELEDLGEESTVAADKFKQFVSGLRSGMQSVQNEWVKAILDGFDAETKAAQEAADDQFKIREKAFDADFKQREKALDAEWKQREKALDAEWKQREKAFDNQWKQREKALDAEHDLIIKAATKQWDERLKLADKAADQEAKAADKAWEARIKAAADRNKQEQEQIKNATDARVKAIEDQMAAEDKLEKKRQAMFDAEKSRISEQARANQQLINMRFALASGDLQQAAIIQEQAIADQWTRAMDIAAEQQKEAAERVREGRRSEIEQIKEEGNLRVEQVKRVGEAEQERLKEQRELNREAMREAKDLMRERLRAERENALDRLKVEKDLAKERLQTQRDAEREALQARRDTEREALQARRDTAREAMQLERDTARETMQLERDTLRRRFQESRDNAREIEEARLQELIVSAPKNEREFARMQEEFLAEATRIIGTRSERDRTAGRISAETWHEQVRIQRRSMEEDHAWERLGENVGDRMIRGMLGMSMIEFRHWAETGKFHSEEQILGQRRAAAGRMANDRALPGDAAIVARHKGGMAGSGVGSNRLGRSGPLYSDEIPTVLQRGEYVIDKKTTDRFGPDFFAGLQRTKPQSVTDEHMHRGGVREAMSGFIAGSMEQGIRRMLRKGANKRNQLNLEEGNYDNFLESEELGIVAPEIPTFAWGGGDIPGLDAAQSAIAAQIWEIGNSLKASSKMLTAAFMAALVESNMRNINYGDRDSVGIFQQRPSMGWGTIAQIMNPDFAIRSFFQGRGGNRGALAYANHQGTPGQLAQAVQRSAFPARYDQRAPLVAQIMAALQGGGLGGGTPGRGIRPPDHWAPGVNRGIQPWVADIVGDVLASIPGGQRITSGLRPGARVKGTGRPSLHGMGRAVDVGVLARSMGGTLASEQEGDRIAAAFRRAPRIQEVLWKTWTGGNHFNHVHAGFRHLGGLIGDMDLPSLFAGGRVKFDNTLANLHRGETVLTSKLTDKLERGVNNIDSGVSNTYNININVEAGATDIDVKGLARQVRTEIEKLDGRSGHNRRI